MQRPRLHIPRRRARTIAYASLFLLAQAVALVDIIAVRHTWCAEHGELLHVTGAEGAPSADGGVAALRAARQGATDAHDHCGVLAARNEPPQTSPAALVAAPAIDAPRPPVALVRSSSLDLLRLAPKTSPPAA